MIELLSATRCIGCDRCVDVCPTDVFDRVPGAVPVIARQGDCQTCFLCEAWCPVDALWVAAERVPLPAPPAEAGPSVFSLDGVVKGWKQGLTGIPTRSRVLLEIPPALGYGEEGQPPDIQGDDTLYFVIDVLGTSTA